MPKTDAEKEAAKAAKVEAKAKADAEKAAAKAEADAEKEAAKADKHSATVKWTGGERTYSREVHGDDFMDHAEEFATKKGGTVA